MRTTTRTATTLKALLMAVPLLALAACGGDDGTGPDGGDELSEAEVGEMMEAMAAAGAFTPPSGEGSLQSPPAGSAAVPFSYDVDATTACPGGGSVTLAGSAQGDVDQETGAGDFTLTMSQSHDGCVASSDAGMTFTFDGAPSFETSMDFTTTAEGAYTITGSHAGTLGWATGDRSGTCAVDIAFDFSGSEASFSGSAQGTVCGVNVSESLDVGIG